MKKPFLLLGSIQFFHKFVYDAMGNLKHVWTSRDGKHWTLESALKYYPDGKLMRREIRPKDLIANSTINPIYNLCSLVGANNHTIFMTLCCTFSFINPILY